MAEDYILRTEGLSKRFGGFPAVDGIDLNVRRGSVHALIGPNGAGKTTTFNLITKTIPPSGGRIFFNGDDITGMGAAKVAQIGMVRSFQISAIFGSLTVLENVRFALQSKTNLSFQFWRTRGSLDSLEPRAVELLSAVGLSEKADVRALHLPYGQRRALELATTLAMDPELLLLDEPTSGMGQEDVGATRDLIRRIAASRTVIIVEHNLSVVEHLSDTVTVLARGKVLAEGTFGDVSKNPEVLQAYIGKDA